MNTNTDTLGRTYAPCPACHYVQTWQQIDPAKPAKCCECGA